MWGTNQQWWQMPYGYQYQPPAQGSSEDWATKAAMWAEQKRVQEHTRQYYNQVGLPQPVGYHGDPVRHPAMPYVERKYDTPSSNHQSVHEYPSESMEPPPLPPEPETEPAPPGLVPEQPLPSADNMDTIAMEAEAPEPATPIVRDGTVGHEFGQKPGLKVNNFDVHHAMPTRPDYCPSPPLLANRETFDHNHGYNTPPPSQPFTDPLQFDYGHQSASIDYNHQRQGPVVFDYSRQYDGGYQQSPYEGEKYFPPAVPSLDQTPRTEVAVSPGSVDFSALSDVKKKGLPLWIREGLERMEKQKQKKQENQSPGLNNSSSSLSSISGYKLSTPLSPDHSPKKGESQEESAQEEEEEEEADEEERREDRTSDDEEEEDEKPTLRRGQHLFSKSRARSPKAQESSEEEDSKVDDAEREQNLVFNIRRLLTDILLTVTNEEVTSIAQEAYFAAATGSARQPRHPSGVGAPRNGGVLGLAGYGSDSGSEGGTEKADEQGKEGKRRSRPNEEDDSEYYDDRRRNSRSQKHRDDLYASDSDEEHPKSHRSSKRRKKEKRRRSRSRSSEAESDRSGSTPERKKSRRRKHSRRERSRSSSPKHRSKRHGSRKSRSRSKSPKKHKSSRKSNSRSGSPNDIDSRSAASKHKRSKRSRSRERKKPRSSSRRSPGSPGGKKDRKQKSRSRSRSSSPPRRGKH